MVIKVIFLELVFLTVGSQMVGAGGHHIGWLGWDNGTVGVGHQSRDGSGKGSWSRESCWDGGGRGCSVGGEVVGPSGHDGGLVGRNDGPVGVGHEGGHGGEGRGRGGKGGGHGGYGRVGGKVGGLGGQDLWGLSGGHGAVGVSNQLGGAAGHGGGGSKDSQQLHVWMCL